MRIFTRSTSLSAAVMCATLVPGLASAQEGAASFTMQTSPTSVQVQGDEDVFAPRGNLWELGVFAGLLFMSDRADFREGPTSSFTDFDQPAPEVGLRIAYFPLAFLGLEIEGMGAAARTAGDGGVPVWAARGHLILQVPTSRVTLFGLAGGGRLGVDSDESGNDHDPAFHFGGGLKVAVHPTVSLRVDVRDSITSKRPGATTPHHIEGLAGVSLVFGRPPEKPADTDGDGIVDLQDLCPVEPGIAPDGCPVRDNDRDGVADAADQCPFEPGPAPSGCPVRDVDADGVPDAQDECATVPGIAPTGCPDTDNDGILDRDDRCVDVPGVAPDGCPADSDKDGIIDVKDRCPNEPETQNGFEDDDGCPDEIPEQVRRFTGVIQGIEFDTGKATIRPISARVLDEAASILAQHQSLRVEVVGHSDNRGSRDLNLRLSKERADSVKNYLVEQGIGAERIQTRGAGPDEPIDTNDTFAGRQRNRRIEFRIITEQQQPQR